MDQREKLALQLKLWRKQNNYSQQVVANKLGVSRTTISKLENSKYYWNDKETLEKVIELIGFKPKDFKI